MKTCLILKKKTIQTVKVRGARHTYGVFNPLSVLSEVSHQALHVAFCFLHTTDIKTFRRILILKNKASLSACLKADNPIVYYLFHHMGGVMSDQILRCIDGTQDVCHLDLKSVETGHVG